MIRFLSVSYLLSYSRATIKLLTSTKKMNMLNQQSKPPIKRISCLSDNQKSRLNSRLSMESTPLALAQTSMLLDIASLKDLLVGNFKTSSSITMATPNSNPTNSNLRYFLFFFILIAKFEN